MAAPREVLRLAQRAVMARDVNGFADLFALEGVLDFPFGAAPGMPSSLEGREQIRQFLTAAWAASARSGRRILGYDAVVVHETTDPEVVVVEFDLQGEVSATGQQYQLPYIQVFRIRDGAIVAMRDYVAVDRLAGVLTLGNADAA